MEIGKININNAIINLLGLDNITDLFEEDKSIFDETGNGTGIHDTNNGILSIEEELSNLYDELYSTKDNNKRTSIKNAIKAKKEAQRESIIKDEVAQFMRNTDLPADVASKLINLTLESTEALNMVDRNIIEQKIKAFAEANYIDKEELEKTQALKNTIDGFNIEDINEERQSINSEFESKMAEKAAKLSTTSDAETIEEIHDEMQILNVENHAQNMKLAKDQYLLETDLPPAVANELFTLTTQKFETSDINKSDAFDKSIKNLVNEYNISDDELSKLNPLKSEMIQFERGNIDAKRFSAEVAYQHQVSSLYNILSDTKNEHERSVINAEIIELNKLHENEVKHINKQQSELEYKSLESPKEKADFIYKQQIKEEYEKLALTNDESTKNSIQNKINELELQHKNEMKNFE